MSWRPFARTPSGLALLAVVALAGCAQPNLGVDPWCQLGTGEVEFVPLTDGDEVDVVRGIQGGDHIWGSVRVTGIDWRELSLVFEVLDEEGEEATPPSQLQTALSQCPSEAAGCERGMGETVGFPVIVESVSSILGDDITMRVTASDPDGREASSEYVVVPRREL